MSAIYLTPQQLRDLTSNLELAQVATPREFVPIPADAMRQAIDGEAVPSPNTEKAALALAKIEDAIAAAQDLVDNFLRSRYVLPLATAPSTVTEIMVRVARYTLHNERANADIVTRYKEAMAWLQAIADGTMVLDVPPANVGTFGDVEFAEGSGLYSVEGLQNFADPILRGSRLCP